MNEQEIEREREREREREDGEGKKRRTRRALRFETGVRRSNDTGGGLLSPETRKGRFDAQSTDES